MINNIVFWVNIILIDIVILIILKYLDSFRVFKLYKPFWWSEKSQKGTIPKELIKLERKYDDKIRFYNFWFQVERLKRNKIPGVFAELGVYKGETAKLIHSMNPDRTFHLFDTFEGFQTEDLEREKKQGGKYSAHQFGDTSLDEVKAYIAGNDQIIFHPGHFPETAKDLHNETYALVNIDADLYQPTITACHYFYPRLAPGGVMIIHDYNHSWEGVRKALDEFSFTIPEALIEIPDSQGSVMIIKNVR